MLIQVADLPDLASLCRVSRLWNVLATPRLYRHVVLDIRTATDFPYATGYTEKWMAQLHGLALNTHNQCQNITTLIIQNSHPHNNPPFFRRERGLTSELVQIPPDDAEYFDLAEKNPILSIVCSMVEIALHQIPKLETFVYVD